MLGKSHKAVQMFWATSALRFSLFCAITKILAYKRFLLHIIKILISNYYILLLLEITEEICNETQMKMIKLSGIGSN